MTPEDKDKEFRRYLTALNMRQTAELAKLNKAILRKNAKIKRLEAAIAEAVEAERSACAEVARVLEPDLSEARRGILQHAQDIAKAIEARGK